MSSETPGSGMSPDSGSTEERLRAYVQANAGRFTDEAITTELIRAGYAPDAIRSALAEAASRGLPAPQTGRAVRMILAAYGITFAILSLGMLTNAGKTTGYLMPDAGGGITILAGSLGVALIASLVWVASRRVVFLLAGTGIALAGAVVLKDVVVGGYGGGIFQAIVMLLIGIGLVVLVLRTGSAPSQRTTATLGLLLVAPVLLLVAIAGICVASGLPIPRAG